MFHWCSVRNTIIFIIDGASAKMKSCQTIFFFLQSLVVLSLQVLLYYVKIKLIKNTVTHLIRAQFKSVISMLKLVLHLNCIKIFMSYKTNTSKTSVHYSMQFSVKDRVELGISYLTLFSAIFLHHSSFSKYSILSDRIPIFKETSYTQ